MLGAAAAAVLKFHRSCCVASAVVAAAAAALECVCEIYYRSLGNCSVDLLASLSIITACNVTNQAKNFSCEQSYASRIVLVCALVADKQLMLLTYLAEQLEAFVARAVRRVNFEAKSYVKSFCAADFAVSKLQLPFAGDKVLYHSLNPKRKTVQTNEKSIILPEEKKVKNKVAQSFLLTVSLPYILLVPYLF